MNALVVPSMTPSTDKVKHLSKAHLWPLTREVQEELSDLLVLVRPTLISVDTTLQTYCRTGTSLAQPLLFAKTGNDLALRRRV